MIIGWLRIRRSYHRFAIIGIGLVLILCDSGSVNPRTRSLPPPWPRARYQTDVALVATEALKAPGPAYRILERYHEHVLVELPSRAGYVSPNLPLRPLHRFTLQVHDLEWDTRNGDPPIPDEWKAPFGQDGFYLIQFYAPPRPEWLETLQHEGVQWVGPIFRSFARLAWIRGRDLPTIARHPFINWIGAYHPYSRFPPKYRTHLTRSSRFRVFFFTPDKLPQETLSRHLISYGIVDYQRVQPRHPRIPPFFVISATLPQLESLARDPYVWLIEPIPVYQPTLSTSRELIQTGNGDGCDGSLMEIPLWAAGITGAGPSPASGSTPGTEQLVGVLDTHFNHPDLGCGLGVPNATIFRYVEDNSAGTACVPRDAADCITTGVFHGTAVAGIIAGSGEKDGGESPPEACTRKGNAFGARLWLLNCDDLNDALSCLNFCTDTDTLDAFFTLSYADGSRISNHSWGASAFGDYTTLSAIVDGWSYDNNPATPQPEQTYLWIFAAGNAGPGSASLNTPATAKNDLTVAAIYNGVAGICWPGDSPPCDENKIVYYSSRGPVEDGRHGPDVAAPTQYVSAPFDGNGYTLFNGTSAATPGATGAVTLLRDWLVNVHGIPEPSAALMKALVMNATEYVPLHVFSSNESLPGTNQGWGRINLSILCDDFSSPKCNQRRTLWFENTFTATGEQAAFSVNVTDGSVPLHCTLTWLDPPNLPGGQIVNDLDLWVESPNGTCYPGNQFTQNASVPGPCAGVDSTNVDEGIRISNPTPGAWILHVDATRIDPAYPQQPWALVCSGAIIAKPLVVQPVAPPPSGILTVCNATPATADYSITAFGGSGGFSNNVLLTFLGTNPPDPGFSATFSPNPIPSPPPGGGTAAMTLNVAASVPPGVYTFSVEGNDGSLSVTADNRVKIHSDVPATPVPLEPLADTFTNFTGTRFRWQLQNDADSYHFFLYDNPSCSGTPILSRTNLTGDIVELNAPAEDLQPDQTYGWVVEAVNACGSTPGPCTPFRTWKCGTDPEIVTNGSFETGDMTGWTIEATRGLSGIPGVNTSQAFDGSFAIQLGDYPAFFGFTTPGTDAVYQELTVPPGGAILEFYAFFASVESPGFDLQEATITDTQNVVLQTIFRYGDDERPLNQGWTRFEVDLSPWAGQTIRLHFRVTQDAIYKTGMFIDAVTTAVTRCGPPAYQLQTDRFSYNLCAGSRITTDLSVTSPLNYAIQVTLDTSTPPPGVAVHFFPFTLMTNGLARMVIQADATTPPGVYPLTVTSTGTIGAETLSADLPLELRIAATPPPQPIPVSPLDGDQIFTTTPVFRWRTIGSPDQPTPGHPQPSVRLKRIPAFRAPNRSGIIKTTLSASDANTYHLLVDDAADFSNPEIDVTVQTTSYQPGTGRLTQGTRYYWTVIPSNACGNGPGSVPQAFDIAGCLEQWETVPDLPQGRWGACSVGYNGRYYFFGGFDASFQARAEAWVFDPATNAWAPIDPMPAPRAHMGCTVLNDRIYLVGGTDGLTPSNMVWIYDPSTNSWNSAPNLPQPLAGPAVATVNGLIYACGGLSGVTGMASNQCYRFDPVAQVWTNAFNLTKARYRTHGVALGTLFIAVGSNPGNGASPNAEWTLDICDTTTQSCATSSAAPYPLWFDPGVVAFNGKVYVLGLDNGPNPRQTALLYDPAADTFDAFPDLLSPHNNTTAAIVDSMIYIAGGFDGINLGVTAVERFVFCTAGVCSGQWTESDPIPEGRAWACAVAFNQRLYVFGGGDATGAPLNTAWSYDPSTRVWTPLAPMPDANAYAGCAVVGSTIHLVGGWDGFAPRTAHWVYDPATDSWSADTPLPDGRFGPAVAAVNDELYVCGGMLGSTGLATPSCLHWDAVNHTWEAAPFTLSRARWRTAGVAVGTLFLAVGSNRGLGEAPDAAWTIDICDVQSGTCTPSTRSLFPLEFNPGVASFNGNVYIVGLDDGTGNLTISLEYDPIGNNFMFFPTLPASQNNTTAAVVGDTLYLIGGFDGQNLGLARVQKFQFCTVAAKPLQADYTPVSQPPASGPPGQDPLPPFAPDLPKQKTQTRQDSPHQKTRWGRSVRVHAPDASEPDPRP